MADMTLKKELVLLVKVNVEAHWLAAVELFLDQNLVVFICMLIAKKNVWRCNVPYMTQQFRADY